MIVICEANHTRKDVFSFNKFEEIKSELIERFRTRDLKRKDVFPFNDLTRRLGPKLIDIELSN